MNRALFSPRLFIKGIVIIVLLLILAYTAINSLEISKGNEAIQSRQLETLTKVLVSQAALSASSMIENGDQERLLRLTNQLASERLVFDATIYDAKGVKLAASEHAKPAREILGLDTPLESASIGRLQLIEPVLNGNVMIGYIRITFEKGRVTAISDHHYRNSDRYMYSMILMAFIAGVLLTLLLRRKPRVRVENQLLQEANKP